LVNDDICENGGLGLIIIKVGIFLFTSSFLRLIANTTVKIKFLIIQHNLSILINKSLIFYIPLQTPCEKLPTKRKEKR
jgi:hypothetical protein